MTTAAKPSGSGDAREGEHGLLDAERRTAACAARQLRDGGEGDAVPGHRQRAGDDEGRDEQDERRVQQGGGNGEGDAHRHADPGERDGARSQLVRPAPGADAQRDRHDLDGTEHCRRLALAHPAFVVQVEDDEAEDGHLRHDVEAADAAQPPEAAIAEGPLDILDLERKGGRLAEEDRPGRRADQAHAAEEHVGVVDGELRQDERAHEAADRNRRLPDPEGEAALRGVEPAHHRAPGRGVHARAGGPGEEEEHVELPERLRLSRHDQQDAAAAHPRSEHDPLADPVGQEAPRDQRHERPEPVAGEHRTHLGEAQPELVSDRRSDRRQADPDRGEAGLRDRARSQHGPAVTGTRYSPKGLIGREPVFTVTLFVSR